LYPKSRINGASAPATTHPTRTVAPGAGLFARSADGGTATIHTGRPSKASRPQAVTPEKILQAFNTWSFKREQPDSVPLLLQVIATAVQLVQPVPFVMYWGKGPRCDLAEPDTACLDYLASLDARVRQAYDPGASFRLILTDTHATLNGHAASDIKRYFDAVEGAARQRGFDACWLSELVFAAESAGAIDLVDEEVPQDMLERLGECAAKWFRGEGTPQEGAARYLQLNMVEKRAVQFAFPRSIFVTFNGSEFRNLFPDRMPIFYMYSMRRGTSVKPWFLPALQTPLLFPPAIAAE
jgi:hypothetical protein